MNTVKYILYGLIMGVSNVIPGVSGGTMAVILNFYDRLMECITLDFKVIKKNLNFLIPLAIGMVIAILGLSKVMQFLLLNYPTQTYFAFIGIVFGSLPLIYSKASIGGLEKKNYLPMFFTLILMIALSLYNKDSSSVSEVIKYTTLDLESFIMCFLALMIAAVTMIVPGISGALVLIILGMYGTIVGYVVADFYIPLLIPSLLGGIFGILGGAKVVRFLLKHFQQATYMAILGLLLGSLVELYNNANLVLSFNGSLIASVLIMIVMFILVYWFSNQEIKRTKKLDA